MFDVGDKVRMKTGGPAMVVTDNEKGDWSDDRKRLITCRWMANNLLREDDFLLVELELVKEE